MSLTIQVDVHAAGTLAFLKNAEKRMGYAIKNAINSTAIWIQAAERQNVLGILTVRKPEFIRRQVAVIKPFARHDSFHARIAIGQKERLILAQLEGGGIKQPATPGARRVGVPITGSSARPTFRQGVPPQLELRRLKFKRTRPGRGLTKSGRRRRSKGGGKVLYGPERTFKLPNVEGVLRRTGPGKRDVELIHSFDPHVPLRKRLGWIALAQREAHMRFGPFLEAEVRKTLEFAAAGAGAR